MKLTKIYFDAYKSLLNKEIELKDQCVGLVGINESGKSNILQAINVLGGHDRLTSDQAPKMGEKGANNPRIRYGFELSPDEKQLLKEKTKHWLKNNTLLPANVAIPDIEIIYHVEYDLEGHIEERYFEIEGFNLDDKYLFLKSEYHGDQYKIMIGNHFVPLMSALVLQEHNIKGNEKRASIESSIQAKEDKIDELRQSLELIRDGDDVENVDVSSTDKDVSPEHKKIIERILKLREDIGVAKNKIFEFDFHDIKKELVDNIEIAEHELVVVNEELEDIEEGLSNYQGELDEDEKTEKSDLLKKKRLLERKEQSLSSRISDSRDDLNQLMTPLGEKYSKDPSLFLDLISSYLGEILDDFLPAVVFWQYDESHILQSETMFSDILRAESINDISRPLFNIFRIGLEVNSLDDLKSKIAEVQENANDRSKLGEKLNKKVNLYIKNVWKEYDQDLRITLEKERIRVEIFDPKFDDHNFYYMEVRSQGAKTFLSFLLTIGVEAKKSVISNTVLLLDEPETHLHPSGVRFLLQELIKISQRNNQVIYATHSIFMIDKENYGRHVIVEKKSEETSFKYAQSDRIGYFMQEEVLYKALDLEFSNGKINKKYNFVFEGDADTKLFQKYYSLLKGKAVFPVKDTSFYYGGGCKNIQKYLKQRPLQLGSVWIFILDSDQPADNLHKFIKSVYKNYIDQDIFVFQYNKVKVKKSSPIELEDILPSELIFSCFENSLQKSNIDIDDSNMREKLIGKKTFTELLDYFAELYLDNDQSQKNSFKEFVKDALTEEVSGKIEAIKRIESFSQEFNEYYCWAESVIEKLNDTIK